MRTSFQNLPLRDLTNPGKTRGTSLEASYVAMLKKLLPEDRKLDYIMDDWYWIPRGWSWNHTDGGRYHFGIKYLNIVQCAREGLLNKGCKLFVHCHIDALRFILKPVTLQKIVLADWPHSPWKYLLSVGFTPRVVTWGDLQRNPHVYPLWGATFGAGSMSALDTELAESIREWLLFYARDNLCGQKPASITYKINTSIQANLTKDCLKEIDFTDTNGVLTHQMVSKSVTDNECPFFIEFTLGEPDDSIIVNAPPRKKRKGSMDQTQSKRRRGSFTEV